MNRLMLLALTGMILVVPPFRLKAQDRPAAQERAITAIKKLGGTVEVDRNRPGSPVVGVDLKHAQIIDASLEHLQALPTVEALLLHNTAITDDGLVHVAGLTNLEVLELGRTKVTDRGLAQLKGFTKILRLDLGGTQVTDKGLQHLIGLTRLETLNLENVEGVSDAGLTHLKGMTHLRELNLTGTAVTAAGARVFQQEHPLVKIRR